MRRIVVVVFLAAGCAKPRQPAVTEKGTSTGAKATRTIGPAGGTLASADGRFAVDFPSGALAADTEIGLEPITNTAPLGRGGAYRLTPDGAKFDQPVKLSFRLDAADVTGSSEEAAEIAFQDGEGHWRAFEQHDLASDGSGGKRVFAQTTHFTDYSLVLGWQLRPEYARVAPLDSLELKLAWCQPEEYQDLAGLIYDCNAEDADLPRLVTVNQWAVNGKAGGSLSDGVISGHGRTATYTAPGTQPVANPVAVSVEFARTTGKQLAISNVQIAEHGWAGTVSWTLMGSASQTVGDTMHTWMVTGGGTLTVKSGAGDQPAVDTASATYSWQHDEVVNRTFTQNGCDHTLMSRRTETLAGMSMSSASVFVAPDAQGNTTLTVGVPTGAASGRIVVDSTDTVTGPAPCASPMPTHTDSANNGAMPGDTFVITVMGATDRLMGSSALHVDGMPPRDYAISYDLAR